MSCRRICLAGFAATAAVMLVAGCGSNGRVTLAQLVQRQQSYAGSRIDTRGVVREERDPNGATYFVLADGAGDLVGLKPGSTAKRYAGLRVDVTGHFRIQKGFGRVIQIVAVSKLGPG